MVCHLLINAIIVAPFWRNPSIEDIQQLKNFEKPLEPHQVSDHLPRFVHKVPLR